MVSLFSDGRFSTRPPVPTVSPAEAEQVEDPVADYASAISGSEYENVVLPARSPWGAFESPEGGMPGPIGIGPVTPVPLAEMVAVPPDDELFSERGDASVSNPDDEPPTLSPGEPRPALAGWNPVSGQFETTAPSPADQSPPQRSADGTFWL